MTLHETITIARKAAIGIAIGIGIILLIWLLVRLAIIVKNIIAPPKTQPANHLYDKLPAIQFPTTATTAPLTYTFNTDTGGLPDFPDRINIYPITQPVPNLLNLNKAKDKAKNLGFTDQNGTLVPEKTSDSINYEWDETKDPQRILKMNTITFNFTITSNYLASLTVLNSAGTLEPDDAVNATNDFLTNLSMMPTDVDLNKTTTPTQASTYVTNPQSFSIQSSVLVPTTSFLDTQVYRVDLYQKDLSYDLDTGVPQVTGGFKTIPLVMPILYPHPPYSTMSFWVANGDGGPQVFAANFAHQTIDTSAQTPAIYPIKSTQEAFDELKKGKAYIASYHGPESDISITNVYLTYYLGENPQEYLMPIIVFQGENGFFAYVSALSDEWIK